MTDYVGSARQTPSRDAHGPVRRHAKGPGGDPPPGPFGTLGNYSGDRFGRHTTSALVCWTSW